MKLTKKSFPVQDVTSAGNPQGEIDVIGEAPVSLTVNGEVWLTFMCTPLDLEALAVGFLYNEGIINSIEEVASVRVCPEGDNVDIWLEHHVDKPLDWSKTSGCTGGMTSISERQDVESSIRVQSPNGALFDVSQVLEWVQLLLEAQGLYRETGGVHTSALIDGRNIILITEDIGRHNTLDKIAGRCLLENISPQHKIIITTGRISSEMLHKAARIGVSVLVSRTSPTSLSIELAEKYGITLIGYARRDQFKIYCCPQRIIRQETSILNSQSLH
jgi:FdhD protein